MNPVSFAFTGLTIGLWLNALNLLGISAAPMDDKSPHPARSVAIGSLTAAITLFVGAVWLIIGSPFGSFEAWPIMSLFAGVMGMFSMLWIFVFVMQWVGLDPRPVGNVCLLMAIMQIIYMIGYAQITGMATTHDLLLQLTLASYVVLLLMFWRLLNGKLAAAPVGWWAMLSTVGTLYLLYTSGSVFLPL